MSCEPVFVYGTLRRGGSNHFRMAHSEPIGPGRIGGRIYRIDWYPALVCGSDGSVRGELYNVSGEHLRALDEFEGITPNSDAPREYRRVKVGVELDSGESADAWVWEWIGGLDGAEPLDGDDWLAYEPDPS